MISIIVPTYNEAGNIKELVKQIGTVLKSMRYEVIVIDDDSPDGTYKIARSLPKVRAFCRKRKRGLSSAVIDGFSHAKGEHILVMDADLSHPPKYLPKLIDRLKDHDLVIGSRLVKGGSVQEWPFHRKLLSFGARMISRPLTSVKDTMSGFFAFRREIIKDVKLNGLGYKILLEVIVKGKAKKISEVPFTFVNRGVGESKITGNVCFEYLQQVSSLMFYKIKNLKH
ncbi:hypothetical protein COV93_01995 [Candidatus Woesearchaeota archaeon CG11_big_fil_rev_8_21_14_0_20_43_8]|nr:MAG: hypothetical protein COV93_01995 [Candidatus Woesearchaeota archaeon CG11_big_fil_rev_8_21_14_0_20_43_8]